MDLSLPRRVSGDDGTRRYLVDTPVGVLSVVFNGEYLVGLAFSDASSMGSGTHLCEDLANDADVANSAATPASGVNTVVPVFRNFRRELDLYFEGRLRSFSVKLGLTGPPFFLRVWRVLMEIPFGETRTYADVASLAGSPKAWRAVGNACAANPIAIVVPCHRVVASEGLGGYGGGLARKEWLLDHEARYAPGCL